MPLMDLAASGPAYAPYGQEISSIRAGFWFSLAYLRRSLEGPETRDIDDD